MKPDRLLTSLLVVCLSVLLVAQLGAVRAPVRAQPADLGEALDSPGLTWVTGGDAAWFPQTAVFYYDGDAAQSGAVAAGQTSWLETTVTGPGLLAFYWKLTFGFTWLSFHVDGVKKIDCNTTQWQIKTWAVPAGVHTLRWVWAPSMAGYAGYVDKVVYLPAPAVLLEAPNGGESWVQRSRPTIRWQTTEPVSTTARLDLYRGGELAQTIAAGTANDGSLTWFVPATLAAASDYAVRVSLSGQPAVYDESDAWFSVSASSQTALAGALVLDGDDDYADTADDVELDLADEPGESLTAEAWFYLGASSSHAADRQHVVRKAGSLDLYAVRYLDYGTMNHVGCIGLGWTLSGGAPRGREHCHVPAYPLGWHHLALVYQSATGQAQFYLDGGAFGDPFALEGLLANSAAPLALGENLSGALDEVRLSATARYTGATYPVPSAPLTCDGATRALWHLDEFHGATILHDRCGLDNVLTGHNGAHTEGVVPAVQLYLPLLMGGSSG